MGFFDLYKGPRSTRSIRCTQCGNPIADGEAKTINGAACCPGCYRELSAEQSRRRSDQPSRAENTRSFEDKYDKVSGARSSDSGKPARNPDSGSCPDMIRKIKDVLDRAETQYREEHSGDQWDIVTAYSVDGKRFCIRLICKGETSDTLAVRVFSLVNVQPRQYRKLYPVLNQLQETYRYLRFTLDADGDVNAEYDVANCSQDAGLVALESILRVTKILDAAYPTLKKAANS